MRNDRRPLGLTLAGVIVASTVNWQPIAAVHGGGGEVPGISVRCLTTGPGLDLAAGRIGYLINGDDLSLIVRFGKDRFAKELIVDLTQSTADRLMRLLDLT